MRVFIDVGASTGQSLNEILNYSEERIVFDRIICIEPSSACWPHLAAYGLLVKICPFGLSDRDEWRPLYESGRKGASLWAKSYARSTQFEYCNFRRASDWFRETLSLEDQVWLKLNCEGAEVPILEDLLSTGEFSRVTYALVSFHGDKIPELLERERALREQLQDDERVTFEYQLRPWLDRTTRRL